jgi:hypothetical protein
MSLINDALKKAGEAKLPPQADVGSELQPVEHRPRSIWFWVGSIAALMLAGFLAIWAIVVGVVANNQLKATQAAAAREAKIRYESASPVQNSQPAISSPLKTNQVQPQPGLVPTESPLGAAQQSAKTNIANTNATVAAAQPPKPAAPVLKLQGILWKPSKPLAMINAKMVGRGDKILGAKVVAIDQESVTLDRAGETIVLTLP